MKWHIPENSNKILEKFVNSLMKHWKKTVARNILSDCFEELKKMWHKSPQEAFEKALHWVMPTIEVKSKRVWWAVYQVPIEVTEKRQMFLSILWILTWARTKKWMPMHKKLAIELNDALSEAWYAFKKREEVHKMAQANKAFAHFARY